MKNIILELVEIASNIKLAQTTKDYSSLTGQVERWQSLVNKMEAALYDQSDLRYAEKQLKELKKEIEALEKKKEGLT